MSNWTLHNHTTSTPEAELELRGSALAQTVLLYQAGMLLCMCCALQDTIRRNLPVIAFEANEAAMAVSASSHA
jgi:hypothetical protein